MALVDNRALSLTETMNRSQPSAGPRSRPTAEGAGPEAEAKQVFLVALFRGEIDGPGDQPNGAPQSGVAEQVVAVIASDADGRLFAWVGEDAADSVARPARIAPLRVDIGLPSPWHPPGSGMLTGLVRLEAGQLGGGTVDADVDHLLLALADTRS
jgi:hypothetical protein